MILPTSDKLNIILPVQVKTWMVSKAMIDAGVSYKKQTLDYLDINTFRGTELYKEDILFSNSLTENDRGIHIHWFLPKVLTHGIQYKDDIVFPAVPNRWIISRFTLNKTTKVIDEKKDWIIESDYIGPDGTSNWVIENSNGDFIPTKIGKSFGASDWKEISNVENAEKLEKPLTIIAPGNALFSADYWSCRNVFGFHDKTVEHDKDYVYVTFGWYSSDKLNPIHDSNSLFSKNPDLKKDFVIFFNENLKIASHINENNEIITEECSFDSKKIVCNGNTGLLKFNDRALDNEFEKNNLHISVGNNLKEALSAIIAKRKNNQEIEPLVTAFLNGFLKDNKYLIETDCNVYEQAFITKNGGSEWEVVIDSEMDINKKKDKQKIKNSPDDTSFKNKADYELYLQALYNLNEKQNELDNLEREKDAWVKYCRAEIDQFNGITSLNNSSQGSITRGISNDRNKNFEDKIEKNILSAIDSFTKIQEKITSSIEVSTTTNKKKTSVAKQFIQAVENSLKNCNDDEKNIYVVKQKKLPAFYEAAEPTLLFEIPESQKINKVYEPEIANKSLPVLGRFISLVISDIQHEKLNGLSTKIDDFINKNHVIILFGEQYKCIIKEALLFATSNHFFDLTIKTIVESNAIINWYTNVDSPKSLGNNSDKLIYFLGNSFNEVKWEPLFVFWRTLWNSDKPYKSDINPFYARDNWSLNHHLFKEEKINTDKKYYKNIEGSSILSTINEAGFNGQIKRTIESIIKSKLYTGQSILGFNQQLIKQKRAINIPIMKSPAFKKIELILLKKLNSNIWTNLLQQPESYFLPDLDFTNLNNAQVKNDASKYDNDFSLIRSGSLHFKDIYLTDSFGRVNNIVSKGKFCNPKSDLFVNNDNKLITAKEFVHSNENTILLTPRILHANRIHFKTASITEVKTESPIYAWLLLNRLNNSLFVFNANKKFVGELLVSALVYTNTFLWRTNMNWEEVTKEKGEEYFSNIETIKTIQPLKNLLTFITKKPEKWLFFRNSITDKASRINNINLDQQTLFPNLVGIPLALVNTTIGIEFSGFPPVNHSRSFEEDNIFNDMLNSLKQQKISIRLGSDSLSNDGLVAYSTDDNAETFFSDTESVNFFEKKPLEISLIERKKLTLLMHPLSAATVLTGFLPPYQMQLPYEIAKNALDGLQINFLVSPVIANEKKINLPIPLQQGATNKWVWNEMKHNDVDKKGSIVKYIVNEHGSKADNNEEDIFSEKILFKEGYLGLEETPKKTN